MRSTEYLRNHEHMAEDFAFTIGLRDSSERMSRPWALTSPVLGLFG